LSNKPEQPSNDKRTEQTISDARLADALAINDRDFSARITRATKQANDLVVNQDCIMDGNQLEETVTTQEPVLKRRRIDKQAQHSPKRQRVSIGTLIMGASAKATPDITIRELKNDYYEQFGHLPRGRFASNCAW
jgi:hypothetical protein